MRQSKGSMQSFEKLVTLQKFNQGEITLVVAPQMWPFTNHIMIKFHHLISSISKEDVIIKHIDSKEYIKDILQSL